MLRVNSFVYCEDIKKDKDGKINLIGPLQFIKLLNIPSNFSFAISFGIQGIDIERENYLKIEIKDPEDNLVFDSQEIIIPTPKEDEVRVTDRIHGIQFNMDLRNFEFKTEGKYASKIYFNDEDIGNFPIDIIKVGD